MKIHNIIIILLFVVLSIPCFSEEVAGTEAAGARTLTMDEAVELALAHNLMLASERIGLDTKKRTKDTAWNYFIPSVSLSGTLARPNEAPMGAADILPEELFTMLGIEPGETPHTWSVGLRLSASLTIASSMFYGIKHTLLDYESGLIGLDMAERNLAKNVKSIFYNILLTEATIALMEENIEAAKDRYEQAVSNYNNGLVSEYVKLSTQVMYENMKPGLQDLKIAYDTMVLSFKNLLDIDSRVDISLDGSIEPWTITLDREQAMRLIEGKSELRLQKKVVEILKNAKDVSQSSLYPVFTVSFTFDPTFQGDPFADPWFDNIEDSWSQMSGNLAFVVTIPIDGLFPGSRTRVDIAKSKDAIKQAELGVMQIRQSAELEIESIFMKLQKSQKALDTLALNVDLAEKAYALAKEAYEAGSKELLEVRNSELELRNAKLEVLKEKFNYIMGLLDLEYSLNISLMEDDK
jgi:outer membrane protein TolC